ncbi:MAG: amidase family protein [Alphaproteobacteria bacterium]|nr:amidase family protein [Alphaproteobacteria bacterium]
MNIDIPEILTRPLSKIATDMEDQRQRSALYTALREQRDRMEPSLNAFEARRETQPVEVAAPLHGLPITVKDQIAVSGWRRHFGLDRTKAKPDRINAKVVDQLVDLGAEVTGKTALPPNAMDFQTYNRRRGHTNNPHNPHFTTGGSSGGGAAAVASGMSLLDLGADLAGSLRLPAAWCGVTSLTPTEGKLSVNGMLRGAQGLDHFARIGPIARRVEDLAFVWSCLTATVGKSDNPVTKWRIGIWAPNNTSPCDEATHSAWVNLAQTIDDPDLFVEPDAMSRFFSPDAYRLFGEIMGHKPVR